MQEKLTSRKFWMAIITIIMGVLGVLGADDNIIQMVSSIGLVLIPAVIYIIVEGKIDAAAVAKQVNWDEIFDILNDYFIVEEDIEECKEEEKEINV